MTARTNQVGRERTHTADALIVKVLRGINAGKAATLIEKALLWAGQPRGSIRLCGASFLRLILQHADIKLSLGFLERYVVGAGGVFERAAGALREEAEVFEARRREEQGARKLDAQWGDILNEMEAEEGRYESDPAVI